MKHEHHFTTRKTNPDRDVLEIYMNPMEFAQLMAVMHALRPRHVLEWGAGGSTAALLAECPYIERFVSIEHNRGWYENVARIIDDPRLSLYCVEPTVPQPPFIRKKEPRRRVKQWEERCERDRSVLAEYVDLPLGLDMVFDLVLVDGRARVFCIERGYGLLRPGGMLVLHDAERTIYRPALERLGDPLYLEPWEKGQIALLRKPD
jgi:predicted O-methyltransferase YrrM